MGSPFASSVQVRDECIPLAEIGTCQWSCSYGSATELERAAHVWKGLSNAQLGKSRAMHVLTSARELVDVVSRSGDDCIICFPQWSLEPQQMTIVREDSGRKDTTGLYYGICILVMVIAQYHRSHGKGRRAG